MATPKRTIAVQHKNKVFFQAVAATLTPLMENVNFVHIMKLTQLPEDCDTVATVGMPNFPPDKMLNVISFSAEYSSDEATKTARWLLLNDENATVQELAQALAKPKHFGIIPEVITQRTAVAFAEARVSYAEADTTEDPHQTRLDALTTQRDLAKSVSTLA